MPDTKTPLWKQLVGAATGAAFAFIVYQGYTFTSDHLTALITLPQGSGIMDRSGTPSHVWPTGTAESPSAAADTASSAPASSSTSSDTAGIAPADAAMHLWSSSAASSSSWSESSFGVEPPLVTKPLVTGVEWSSSKPAYSAPVVSMKKHPGKLPQSGFGLDVLAVVALGAMVGRKKTLRKQR